MQKRRGDMRKFDYSFLGNGLLPNSRKGKARRTHVTIEMTAMTAMR